MAALNSADGGWVFDNSDPDRPYRLLLETGGGAGHTRHPPIPAWCESLVRELR